MTKWDMYLTLCEGHSRESGRQKQRGCLGRTPGQSLDSCSTEGDEAKLA